MYSIQSELYIGGERVSTLSLASKSMGATTSPMALPRLLTLYIGILSLKLCLDRGLDPSWYMLFTGYIAECMFGSQLSRSWTLTHLIRHGCPLSALLFAIATHPLLLCMDHFIDTGQLRGLRLLGTNSFMVWAYADAFILCLRIVRKSFDYGWRLYSCIWLRCRDEY